MAELIITNGDMAADLMRQAGFSAYILPWRDVLHEGPVPETASLESLSSVRASFLAEAFDMAPGKLAEDMKQRDRTLRAPDRFDEITLWFEHDLYDQLQLLQLLDFFHHEAGPASLYLVQADDYLGQQSPDGIKRMIAARAPVSAEQKKLAAEIFSAFRRPTPVELVGFFDRDLSPLPYMKAALKRLFDELPGSRNGLSRTQRQTLISIENGKLAQGKLFGAVQAMEEAMFMGDWSFWRCIEELAFNTDPLVDGLPCRFSTSLADDVRQRYLDAVLSLTDIGRAVLAGERDHAEINRIDRWLGGIHVTGDAIWRWEGAVGALVPPSF